MIEDLIPSQKGIPVCHCLDLWALLNPMEPCEARTSAAQGFTNSVSGKTFKSSSERLRLNKKLISNSDMNLSNLDVLGVIVYKCFTSVLLVFY